MGYVGNPLDPWGAADATTAYGACFRALAASGAYDVLAIVHDFPYRSLPSEVNTANEVTRQLLAATADHPELLPVYVSLTSGEPPPETKHVLDTEGGSAVPAGCGRGIHGDRFAGPLGAPTWGAAADRSVAAGVAGARRRPHDLRPGAGLAPEPPPTRTIQRSVLSEIDSLELLGAAGLPIVRTIRAGRRTRPSPRPTSSAIPSC